MDTYTWEVKFYGLKEMEVHGSIDNLKEAILKYIHNPLECEYSPKELFDNNFIESQFRTNLVEISEFQFIASVSVVTEKSGLMHTLILKEYRVTIEKHIY